ncbi:uncharacterized protein ankrd2 [Halichoeres trimaculatus]|uniref:uncharacterized protein ankrd2 n=1 Tax=Halichoeres trimaculatus TaxID=147232 RepID=UPI003D9E6CF9
MENAERWTVDLMDGETGTKEKPQAEHTAQRIPDFGGEILEEVTELSQRQETVSPRVSVEIHDAGCGAVAEFMDAASQGDLQAVEKYLSEGGDPDVHDELKRTALHRCSLQGHAAVIHALLERGADIDFRDQLGSRAVHWACRGGSLGSVKALSSRGADLDVRDKLRSTPLHVATRTGHAAIVEFLLSCGATINSRDREGDTALHDAVRLNRYRIVKLLVCAGADTEIKNHEGLTAVQQVKQWQFDVMETLQRLDKLRELDLLENPPRGE